MTAVADVDPNALSSWFQQSAERDVERTAVLPVVRDEPVQLAPGGNTTDSDIIGDDDLDGGTGDGDAESEPLVAAGRFQHYLHVVAERSQCMTMEDGRPVQFAVCNFVVRLPDPSVMRPAWPYCPVCWVDQSGHDFAWEYKPKGVIARCTRAGCRRTHPEIYDPAARQDPACRGEGAVEQQSRPEPG